MGVFNWVHLKTLIRKNFLIMKADKKKAIIELIVTLGYGALIGYEVSTSLTTDDTGESSVGAGLGYVIFVLLAPIAT